VHHARSPNSRAGIYPCARGHPFEGEWCWCASDVSANGSTRSWLQFFARGGNAQNVLEYISNQILDSLYPLTVSYSKMWFQQCSHRCFQHLRGDEAIQTVNSLTKTNFGQPHFAYLSEAPRLIKAIKRLTCRSTQQSQILVPQIGDTTRQWVFSG
jgi:hypothetical protein